MEISVCASCGDKFVAVTKWQKFCSDKCRMASHSKKIGISSASTEELQAEIDRRKKKGKK